MQICLIAFLGAGLLCSGGDKATVTDSFCQIAGPDIVRLRALSDTEIAALSRPRKEAIASLRRAYKRECEK